MVGPPNCFATRYGRFRIRIQSPTMQLGLRFATAKLPGLRSDRVAGNLVERSGTWWPHEPIVVSEVSLLSPASRSVVE